MPEDIILPDDGEKNAINTLKNIEKSQIESVLKSTNGNISQAASKLGLSRQALYRRIEKLNIKL